MANITGPYPPQLALPPHFSILESFDHDLPDYQYSGTPHTSSLGTISGNARPPQYGVQRPARTTQPATGAQSVPNLWQDVGQRYLQRVKDVLRHNWIQLQPIWQQIQQEYNNHYVNAYNAASGRQPPANFTSATWTSMTQSQRNMVAERVGEQAGRTAVQAWVTREEAILKGAVPGASALAPFAQCWTQWSLSYSVVQENVYMKKQAMVHYNESDVVRAAAMYLVHPVVAAMGADLDRAGGLLLQSEDILSQVRSDITFYRDNGTLGRRPIAVLEFKRRGIIRPDQFAAAMPALAPARPGESLFDYEALKLIKQASAYAMVFRTRHIALCDWNYLVLCYFVDMPYNTPTNVGRRVEIQIIPVGTPSTPNQLGFDNSDNSHHFRPALLGFLKTAYDQTP